MKTIRIQVKVPEDWHKKIVEKAAERGETVSVIVRAWIASKLNSFVEPIMAPDVSKILAGEGFPSKPLRDLESYAATNEYRVRTFGITGMTLAGSRREKSTISA